MEFQKGKNIKSNGQELEDKPRFHFQGDGLGLLTTCADAGKSLDSLYLSVLIRLLGIMQLLSVCGVIKLC